MLLALVLPAWLTDEHAITLATWGLVLVTLLLVVLTFFMWLDSWNKGKDQRERWNIEDEQRQNDRNELHDRWKREDERLAELEKPKYRFGIKRVKTLIMLNGLKYHKRGAELWVANFGKSPLYIEQMFLQHRDSIAHSIEINRIVAPGKELHFVVSDDEWQKVPGIPGASDGNYFFGDHEVWLRLSDATHGFESERFLYELVYTGHSFTSLQRGAHERRNPSCPKCGLNLNHLGLRVSGCLTEDELQRLHWKPALADLEYSCPNHSSNHLWIIQNPLPPWQDHGAEGEI